MKKSSSLSLVTLGISLVLAFAAGTIGSYFTMPAIDSWYAGLVKPSFSPPNWIFGPVWTLLYALMAIAAWRVYEQGRHGALRTVSLLLYAVHLALNTAWSVVFFGWQSPFNGLIVIMLLLVSIFAIMVLFYRLDRIAGYLFVPYLFWVSFATLLNSAILQLN